MTAEDDEFSRLEMESRMRKEGVKSQLEGLDPYRNMIIEEVAREVEKFKFPFGHSTVDSFAIFIRGMKR